MLEIIQRLESTANQLQDHLRFNHSSLRHAVEHLLVEVEQAQNYLYTEGPTIITKVSITIYLQISVYFFAIKFVYVFIHKKKLLKTKIRKTIDKIFGQLSNYYS